MMNRILSIAFIALLSILLVNCSNDTGHSHEIEVRTASTGSSLSAQAKDTMEYEVQKTEEEWKELLSWNEYRILRKRGTELPYVNEYNDNKQEGVYYCGACGKPLFTSKTKFDSGTGWPSFWKPISEEAVGEKKDESFFMTRTETVCSRCGSHLGHVFKDGPKPTGLRYCLNSAALDFVAMDLSKTDVDSLSILEKK